MSASFNPRAREGRDAGPPPRAASRPSFNPRAREGRDLSFRTRCWLQSCFNPRAREGRDRSFMVCVDLSSTFQSTRPRGARPGPPATPPRGCRCFNPRAREGRDPSSSSSQSESIGFQSTRPRGARHVSGRPRVSGDDVSIHAPARGATPLLACHVPSSKVSIHAPARGATRIRRAAHAAEKFQSTRPRGARRAPCARRGAGRPSFNPRAREGRDISSP